MSQTEIDANDNIIAQLINHYINTKLSPESKLIFSKELNRSHDAAIALLSSIVNETTEMLTTEENKRTTKVYCSLQYEATHNWPDCPIKEVYYLKFPHRHIFHIKAYKLVSHDDRDIEFINLKHQIQGYLNHKYPDKEFGSKSCEMLANELIDVFDLTECEVSEDNENGAIVIVA